MAEREPPKETIGQGELFYLWHPETKETFFSGYGLTIQPGSKEFLVGLLMVDRPRPAEPTWLSEVNFTYGPYQLEAMTANGERGIVCQMQIAPDSLPYLRRFPGGKSAAIKSAIDPLLEDPPNPVFTLHWDEETRLWRSEFAAPNFLSAEIREVFENTGYSSLAAETNIGVVHVCHAADTDIQGFAGSPVLSQWQLIEMPTAPLIRLNLVIVDNPVNPYKFESFLNVADEDQARILDRLANQDRLNLAFYGDDLIYRFTKVIPHDEQRWQQLDELVVEANAYWEKIPPEQRDFDLAKVEFMQRFI